MDSYLVNLKYARCVVPSLSFKANSQQVPE